MEDEDVRLYVGGDVDAWCSKCEMVFAHTTIKREDEHPTVVECTNCGAIHPFRPTPPQVSREMAQLLRQGEGPHSAQAHWEEAIHERTASGRRPIPYNLHAQLVVGDLVRHPKFGLGVVIERHDSKVEVIFKDEVKLLISSKDSPK